MDVVDTLENLLGEINDLLHRQAFVFVLFLFQEPLQVTALGEFENEHQTFARSCSRRFVDCKEPDNVRVSRALLKDVNLP